MHSLLPPQPQLFMPRVVILSSECAYADGASLLSCKIKAAPVRGGLSPGDKVAMPGARCIFDHFGDVTEMVVSKMEIVTRLQTLDRLRVYQSL